jgi:type IV pilus assembly protein PilA
MKKINKKGFTLIELLAVIVVLAIVAVLATSQILPLLDKTRKNAFASEANSAIDAASNAMTLIQIGERKASDTSFVKYTAGSGTADDTYCFTLEQLVDGGVLKKDLGGTKTNREYSGKVVVKVPKNFGGYTYTVTMKNSQFSINGISGSVKDTNVDSPATNVSVTC